ncbi:presenilin family intramembrane aspartyl protease PSH [Halorhabdus sp. BNX81]|uniref:presenilin family intramembrane aspartyl protease PSH n=1 Tax=Halorhabdus sp. BNX81 TaxID=2980181 RepID=UPI0023DD42A1|nr:presenilin family intramembrane aspartyl protease PSH [Halorhabdus sp. BNX81]WEL22096.1 Presenilin-like membrane protease, A22 family [Halorhabdus sp. BNX81]
MARYRGLALSISVIVSIFLFVQLGALALVDPFKTAGLQAVEDPQNPVNSLLYIGAVLVMTGVLLAAFKYEVQWAIRGMIVATGAYIAFIVLSMLLPPVVTLPIGDGLHGAALLGALALGIALYVYPEWYVIDATGAVMGAGAAGLFGITFGVFPALVLLSVLAVYDVISVYGTEHMLTIASGVMDLKVPVVLVAPMSLGYSFRADSAAVADGSESGDDGSTDGSEGETTDEDVEADSDDIEDEDDDPLEDREALFIGLGDAIIPTVLVASVAFFADASVPTVDIGAFSIAVPAATAVVGTFLGLAVLLRMVLAGRAHAALPLLNGGAIAGYLVGALATGMSLVETLGLGPYF